MVAKVSLAMDHRVPSSREDEKRGGDVKTHRNTQDTHAERGEEDKEEGRGQRSELVLVAATGLGQAQRDTDDGPARRARERRTHHDATTSVPLDHKVRQETEDEVVDGAGGGQNTGPVCV